MSAVDMVLGKLDKVTQTTAGWSALCPAHPDRSPSLSISNGDGKVLVNCHAGCSPADVVGAIGLRMPDLFDEPAEPTRRRIEAVYPYHDAAGKLLYEVVRFEPKDFRQRRPDGNGGHLWSLQGVDRVLYRLPDVIKAVATGQVVYIAEGEKDADALTAAGVCATTAPQGAGNWSKVDEHARQVLHGAAVVIVHDQDPPGIAHAREVAGSLAEVATIVVARPHGRYKDAADHLGAGHTVTELEKVAGDTFKGIPNLADWLATDDPTADELPLIDPSFQPLDLGPVLAGDTTRPEPTIMRRDDRQALFYPGQVNGIHGDSGTGKGWVALYAIEQQIRAGRNVMLVDTEDVAESIVSRLRLLGATDTAIDEHLIYIRPTAPFGKLAVDHLVEIANQRNVSLVVIDSLGECFGLDGIDENHDAEVGPWLRKVARRLADAGPAVLLLDHSTKANDNPLHPSGSKRKRAAIGGASYLITAPDPLAAGKGGRLRMTCAKDRHGTYARGEHVADLVMSTDLMGTRVALYAPNPDDADDRPVVVLAARSAVEAAKREGQPMTLRTLRAAMSIKAANGTKDGGIDLAVARGALSETSGSRNSREFTYLADLPEGGIS